MAPNWDSVLCMRKYMILESVKKLRFGGNCYWVALAAIAFLGAGAARAQVVASYDFEDGTAQGWTSFNGASVPANSTAAAQSGTHSLLTTTSSSGAGGPSIAVN